jgi:hypothetical protein
MASSTVTPTQKSAALKRPRFKAVFTDEQVKSFEAGHNETWGVKRRLLMMTMARSSKEMLENFAPLVTDNDGDAFFELYEQIKDYRDHLKAGVEMADAAMARLLWVGQYIANREENPKA